MKKLLFASLILCIITNITFANIGQDSFLLLAIIHFFCGVWFGKAPESGYSIIKKIILLETFTTLLFILVFGLYLFADPSYDINVYGLYELLPCAYISIAFGLLTADFWLNAPKKAYLFLGTWIIILMVTVLLLLPKFYPFAYPTHFAKNHKTSENIKLMNHNKD